MGASTLANAVDAASLLEKLLETSDRVRSLLEAGDLSDEEAQVLRSLDETAEQVIAVAEDLLDAQEADDARATPRREGAIPWEELRPRFLMTGCKPSGGAASSIALTGNGG